MFVSLVGFCCRKPRSALEGDRSGGCGPFLEISRGNEVFVWRVVFVGEEPENLGFHVCRPGRVLISGGA